MGRCELHDHERLTAAHKENDPQRLAAMGVQSIRSCGLPIFGAVCTPAARLVLVEIKRSEQRALASHLMQQRQASTHTIASYRDTWRLLLLRISAHRGRRFRLIVDGVSD